MSAIALLVALHFCVVGTTLLLVFRPRISAIWRGPYRPRAEMGEYEMSEIVDRWLGLVGAAATALGLGVMAFTVASAVSS